MAARPGQERPLLIRGRNMYIKEIGSHPFLCVYFLLHAAALFHGDALVANMHEHLSIDAWSPSVTAGRFVSGGVMPT